MTRDEAGYYWDDSIRTPSSYEEMGPSGPRWHQQARLEQANLSLLLLTQPARRQNSVIPICGQLQAYFHATL